MNNIGTEVKVVTALQPQAASGEATAINGITVNRRGFNSAVFGCQIGNVSGSPTRFGITFKVQQGSGESTWADVSGKTFTVSGESVASMAIPSGEINVDLRGLARDVRIVATPTFTGGSSPKVEISSVLVLGEPDVSPV